MSAWTVALIAVCYAGAALVRLSVPVPVGYWLPVLAEGLGVWLAYGALIGSLDAKYAIVLR